MSANTETRVKLTMWFSSGASRTLLQTFPGEGDEDMEDLIGAALAEQDVRSFILRVDRGVTTTSNKKTKAEKENKEQEVIEVVDVTKD